MSRKSELAEQADPVDRHVGIRIRLRRKQLNMSQGQLAEALGVTFQQIQKYERAANRVSASKLWEIAQALESPVSYFYEGLDGETEAAEGPLSAQQLLLSREGVELVAAFRGIHSPQRRGLLLNLISELAPSMADGPDSDD
jgi:transcriptional regulator with XRE-family HTH domain